MMPGQPVEPGRLNQQWHKDLERIIEQNRRRRTRPARVTEPARRGQRWVAVLIEVKKVKTLAQIEADIGYHATTISSVINGRYRGNHERIRAAVEAAYMRGKT